MFIRSGTENLARFAVEIGLRNEENVFEKYCPFLKICVIGLNYAKTFLPLLKT